MNKTMLLFQTEIKEITLHVPLDILVLSKVYFSHKLVNANYYEEK